MRPGVLVVLLAGASIAPATALAHVSVHPNEVPAGSFTTLAIRVPDETPDADVTKVTVEMPAGIFEVSTEHVPGWSVKVRMSRLRKQVQTDDGPVAERVSEIVWSGDGGQGRIPPGQFLVFPFTVEIPGRAGEDLTFKTHEFYEHGQVVHWVGSATTGNPAPKIHITPTGGPLQDVAIGNTTPNPTGTGGGGPESGESADKGLAVAALIVAALGLAAGGAALIRSRRA